MKIYYSHVSFVTAFLLLCTSFSSFSQSTLYQSPCSELIWFDEFDGTTLDVSKWTPQTGDGCPGLCGWGNAELQYYTDRTENVKVEGGNLVITSIKESYGGKNYTSARLRTINKGDFTFGRFVARIKLPQGAGAWSAFWLLPTDEVYGPWAGSGEIDIMEYQGHSAFVTSGTIHYGGTWPDNKYKGAVYAGGQAFYNDFHEFAIEWDSTEIRWYVDNNHFATRSKKEIAPNFWPFHERFHIILNNAVGGHLGGTPNDAFYPQQMLVDYVRVYTTPLNRSLSGKKNVMEGDITSYSIPADAADQDYEWTVPSGATILSGQGTNTISVEWGDTGGDVELTLTKACDVFTLPYPVSVYEEACQLLYNDYQTNQRITVLSSRGAITNNVTNPSTTGINNSAQVGRYQRTGSARDSLAYTNLINENYVPFESGEKNFYLDVYTTAKPGTRIELQLRNYAKSMAGGSTTAGSRSTFEAYTTTQNQWERLMFKFVSVNDATVQVADVDNMVFYFDPELINIESASLRLYHIDNFRRGSVQAIDITGNATPDCSEAGVTYHIDQVSGSSYAWSVPSGATLVTGQNTTDITVNWGTTSGYINVAETDIAGCTDISAQLRVLLQGCPTSVYQSADVRGVKVYPNPAASSITIESPILNYELTLINAVGEKVYTQKYSDGRKVMIDISRFPEGVYLLQMSNENEIIHQKVVHSKF